MIVLHICQSLNHINLNKGKSMSKELFLKSYPELISLDKVVSNGRKMDLCPQANKNGWIVPCIAHQNYIVDERLKNKYINILVTYETLQERRYVKQVLCKHGRIEKMVNGKIIAWMPLPEPYQS